MITVKTINLLINPTDFSVYGICKIIVAFLKSRTVIEKLGKQIDRLVAVGVERIVIVTTKFQQYCLYLQVVGFQPQFVKSGVVSLIQVADFFRQINAFFRQ